MKHAGSAAAVRRTCWTMRSMAPAMAKVPPLVSASLVLVGKARTSPVGTCRPGRAGLERAQHDAVARQDEAAQEAALRIDRLDGDGGAHHHHHHRPRRPGASMRWRAPIIATQRSAPRRAGWS
jgi:hypothetical protein